MSIREHAQQCAQLFRSPQRLGLDSKALVTEFEAQRSRFKVWAGNLGVFAGGRASADSRFQDDPTARGLLVALIEQLNGKLGVQDNACNNKQTSEMVQEADRSDAESHSSSLNIEADTDSDASSDNSDSNENLRHAVLSDIAHIISRLYQFTSVVRRPGTSNERERILRYVRNREPSLDLCELESHIKWQLGRQCPRTAPGTPLHDRIMAAALYRRQRILYFQSHQAKLQTGTDFVFDLPQRLPGVQASIPTLGTGITNDNVGTHPEGSEKNGPALTLITTEATIHVKLPPSTYAKSAVISGTTPSAVGGLGALDIPPPPRPVGGHGAEAQCPYCMHMIDKEQTSKKRWRRHIMKDIEPYLCLFDDCESGSACFKTIEEWIDHMKWNHTAQHGCQVPGHEDRFFETKEELEQHLLVEHEESLPETGLGELVKEGARPSPDILALLASCLNRQEKAPPGNILLCPMCDFSLSEIDNAVSVDVRHLSVMRFSEDVYKEIRAHIASHLESLALLSLPEREDVEAHSSVNQISHSTGQGTSDDEPETSPLPLSFDDYSSEKNEDNLDLPPLQESWPDLLGDFTFGGNDEYDPHSDNLILSFFQQQASGHSITRDELIQVYPAADDKTTDFNIDVVFVHGLTGDAFSTWEKGNTFWPRDLLPSVRNYRNARILTFQFDRLSPVLAAHGSSGPQILKTWGRVLLYELAKTRTASSWRPIIFVGHSTGGNVIKAALSYSDSWKDDFSSILASTKAAVFFSTPHYGLSDRALVALRARLPYSTARVRRRAEEVNKWSQTLDDITSSYVNLTILNTSYFETRPTNDVLITPQDTAKLRTELVHEIDTNHLEICQFDGDEPHWSDVRTRFDKIAAAASTAKQNMDMFFGLEAAEIARHTQRVKEALDRWQIDASYFHPLTQLTQYEFIILFANTESVVQNGRKQLLEETLALIADISTVLTGKGIRVHFVNGKDQWDNQTAGDVTNRTRDTAIKYHGRKRQLGSKLRRFVMEPFLSDRFSHPGTSITVILTDGKPEDEEADTLQEAIFEYKLALEGYKGSTFLIWQVGDDPDASAYRTHLKQDILISDLLFVSKHTLDTLYMLDRNRESGGIGAKAYKTSLLDLLCVAVTKSRRSLTGTPGHE